MRVAALFLGGETCLVTEALISRFASHEARTRGRIRCIGRVREEQHGDDRANEASQEILHRGQSESFLFVLNHRRMTPDARFTCRRGAVRQVE